jgi:hypothetical protein
LRRLTAINLTIAQESFWANRKKSAADSIRFVHNPVNPVDHFVILQNAITDNNRLVDACLRRSC